MAILKIDGVEIKDPSTFQWDISDISTEESGRSTNDGKANKDIIASKRSLKCSWLNPSKDEVSTILKLTTGKAFFDITYPDALSGENETRKFYVGDRAAPMQIWTLNDKRYSSLSFNFVEQ